VPGTRDTGWRWLAWLAVPADLKAVRSAIGTELRKLYSDVLHGEIPDRMAELIKQLDRLMEANSRGQEADAP
jgi:Anti-sigma factor NepR